MTVQNDSNVKTYTGNGVTTVFPYDFFIPGDSSTDQTNVEVTLLEIATGVEGDPLADILWSITGVDTEGYGNVTYTGGGTPLPATHKINIRRVLPYEQNLDLTTQSAYFPELLEEQLDLIVYQIQQLAEETARSVKVSVGSDDTPDELIDALIDAAADAVAAASTATSAASTASTAASAAAVSAAAAAASAASIHGLPSGGSSGQVLAKSSGTDYAVGWIDVAGGMSTVERRNALLRFATLAKLSLGYQRDIDCFAAGFKGASDAADGVYAAGSSNYTRDSSAGCVKPTTSGGGDAGPGAGGGAGAYNSGVGTNGGNGGAGGGFGGGGGGGAGAITGAGAGGVGTAGIIIISYAPLVGSPKVISLTSGTSWVVPADWNSASNTIETIGGGGGGGAGFNDASNRWGGGGGGGGAYSKITNLALTPAASIAYVIGAAGAAASAGGDTWFNGANLAASSVGAKGGAGGTNGNIANSGVGGAGGASGSGIGTTKQSGGNGGGPAAVQHYGGAGGGGAAGPNGDGKAGGTSSISSSGGAGGGGGANNGAAGSNGSGASGGAGGNGRGASGGGAAGNPGGAGTAGSGGGGAGANGGNVSQANLSGGVGAQDNVWVVTPLANNSTVQFLQQTVDSTGYLFGIADVQEVDAMTIGTTYIVEVFTGGAWTACTVANAGTGESGRTQVAFSKTGMTPGTTMDVRLRTVGKDHRTYRFGYDARNAA